MQISISSVVTTINYFKTSGVIVFIVSSLLSRRYSRRRYCRRRCRQIRCRRRFAEASRNRISVCIPLLLYNNCILLFLHR